MPSEIDWENEVDFKEDNENEADENIDDIDEEETEEDEDPEDDELDSEEDEDPEEYEVESEEDEDSEEYEVDSEEDEDSEEYEEEPEEDEDPEEYEEEPEEDEDSEEYEEEPESANRAALFIDGTLTDYKYAEKIQKAAMEQGNLRFAKIYRVDIEKCWNTKIEDFIVDTESIAVDIAEKNEQMKNSILSNCDNVDIVCICTNANFFEAVINELKSRGKKVVLISTWQVFSNRLAKASDVCVHLKNVPVQTNSQSNKKKKIIKKSETPTTPKIPNGVVYIDGNSISPKYAEQIIKFAKSKGNVKLACVLTVKGNDKAKKWKKKAEKFGIRNICFDKGTKKSVIAANFNKDIALEINQNDFFCFAADNAAFGKKAKEIHKSGKKVVILSESELLPELFKICDEIYDLKNNQLYPNYEYAYKKCAINAVLFIDGENIPHEYANLILAKAWEQGNLNLNIGGVYCREDDPATKPWKLKAQIFKLKTNKVKGKAAKNKVDNAIIADALKCMKENENITTFCIASHDKDYAKTVVKLRKAGKRVCVIGKLNMVSDEMRFLCDEFIPISN